MSSHGTLFALLALSALGGLAVGSCGSNTQNANANSGAGAASPAASGSGGSVATFSGGNGTGGSGPSPVNSNYPCKGCAPFPGPNAPACDPGALAPPVLVYPTDGVLLPPNMNVLEVQFVPPKGATLFEVDFQNAITKVAVETQCNPVMPVRGGPSLGCGITLPQQAWNDIANTNRDGDPVKVIVRATADGKCVSGSSQNVNLMFAKDDLAGGIYYWQSATYGGVAGKTGGIFSHDFGSFDPTPTPFYTSGATGTCVGCHNLSRDGLRISLGTDDPDADDEFGDVSSHVLEVENKNVLGGSALSPGFQTFSHDHTKIIASTYRDSADAAFDVFSGDGAMLSKQMLPNMKGTQPDLSKDDKTLLFVVPAPGTISTRGDHHFMGGSIYRATFDMATNTIGAPAALLTADGGKNYYYPSLSPTLDFVIFNEANDASAANNDNDCFYNRKARVKLLHFPGGGQPIDLPAVNLADGLTNSWPRWSPFPTSYHGKKVLWITFSSNRDYGLHLTNKGFDNYYPFASPPYDQPQPASKNGINFTNYAEPQIWMAAIVVDPDPKYDAADRSYPAFWLPFQDVTAHNHSAQWVEKVVNKNTNNCGMANDPCPPNACCSQFVCCAGACTDPSNCIK